MRLSQIFLQILRKYAFIIALIPAVGIAAGVEVLVEDNQGRPLILSNGSYAEEVRPVHVTAALVGLWRGRVPNDEGLIRDVRHGGSNQARLAALIANPAIRGYPGIRAGVWDRVANQPSPALRKAVITAQARWRGQLARRRAAAMRLERDIRQMRERHAAGKIQRAYRAHDRRKTTEGTGFLANLFGKARAKKEERLAAEGNMAGQVEGMDDSAHGDIVTLERRLAALKQEEADYQMAQQLARKQYSDVEAARASARRAAARFDAMGPSRFEQAIEDWKRTHRGRGTGWYKRMLEDLRRDFPAEVRDELRHISKKKPGKYEGKYVR